MCSGKTKINNYIKTAFETILPSGLGGALEDVCFQQQTFVMKSIHVQQFIFRGSTIRVMASTPMVLILIKGLARRDCNKGTFIT